MSEKIPKCSVCKNPTRSERGKPQFIVPSNGRPICFGCIDKRDKATLKEGRLSMTLHFEKGKWLARSLTGAIEYPLNVPEGWTHTQTLMHPHFKRAGKLWEGRVYPSGIVVFQVAKGGKAKSLPSPATGWEEAGAPNGRSAAPAKRGRPRKVAK